MQRGQSVLSIKGIPTEVQRGFRMVAARRNVPIRVWLLSVLYAAIDEELSDYPEWRYQSERPAKDKSS